MHMCLFSAFMQRLLSGLCYHKAFVTLEPKAYDLPISNFYFIISNLQGHLCHTCSISKICFLNELET